MPTGVYKRKKIPATKNQMIARLRNLKKAIEANVGSKHSKETKNKISKANKNNPKLVGQRHSPKTEFKKGHKPESPFLKGMTPWNKSLKGFMSGSENPNWKGGITPFLRHLRTSFEYKQWRKEVFERDDYTCQTCGVRGVGIHADHIKMFSDILRENNVDNYKDAVKCDELWDLSNGQTLCEKCHCKKTKLDLKRNWGFRKTAVGKLPKKE